MDILTVSAAAASAGGRIAAAAVVKQGQATILTAARVVEEPCRAAAVYRAMAYGLNRARQMGAKRVRAVTDEEEVVAHLEGRASVAPSLIGPHLQTRGMLNAFRWSRVQLVARERNIDAVLAAQAALGLVPEEGLVGSLPLWTAAHVGIPLIMRGPSL